MLRALAFLTPLGRAHTPTPRTLLAFPPVGALIGAAVGGLWWLTGHHFPALVAAALTVALDVALTGALHLDGLADTADGLVAPMDRARRLAVMRDPRAGAFGVVAVVVVLVTRFAVLAGVPPAPWIIAALWCASRTAMAAIATTMHYARTEGLATAFTGGERRSRVLPIVALGLAIAIPLAYYGSGTQGLAALGAAAAVAALTAFAARARVGGYTGDVLGAAGILAETAGLVTVAAIW